MPRFDSATAAFSYRIRVIAPESMPPPSPPSVTAGIAQFQFPPSPYPSPDMLFAAAFVAGLVYFVILIQIIRPGSPRFPRIAVGYFSLVVSYTMFVAASALVDRTLSMALLALAGLLHSIVAVRVYYFICKNLSSAA